MAKEFAVHIRHSIERNDRAVRQHYSTLPLCRPLFYRSRNGGCTRTALPLVGLKIAYLHNRRIRHLEQTIHLAIQYIALILRQVALLVGQIGGRLDDGIVARQGEKRSELGGTVVE